MDLETAKKYLPTTKRVSPPNPLKGKYLMMAPPKWGKTTFFSTNPKCLLLAFEEGHAYVDCLKVVITAWNRKFKDRHADQDEEGIVYSSAIEILEALEASCPFNFIVIDTLDVATKLCSEYECREGGIQHPSDIPYRGWDQYQTEPIRRFYNRITKLGVGVAALTHIKEETKENGKTIRETSLSTGVQRFVHNNSDVIMNGVFGDRRKGSKDRDRIISFDATNEVMAGTRIKGVYLPTKYIVDPVDPWGQWANFFEKSPDAGKEAEAFYLNNFRGGKGIDENEKDTTKIVSTHQPQTQPQPQPK